MARIEAHVEVTVGRREKYLKEEIGDVEYKYENPEKEWRRRETREKLAE